MEADTLDNIASELGINGDVDLIKMNIQRAELRALKGASELLDRTLNFTVEVEHRTRDQVLALLKDKGFRQKEGEDISLLPDIYEDSKI